jgi:hypothetical protein
MFLSARAEMLGWLEVERDGFEVERPPLQASDVIWSRTMDSHLMVRSKVGKRSN